MKRFLHVCLVVMAISALPGSLAFKIVRELIKGMIKTNGLFPLIGSHK